MPGLSILKQTRVYQEAQEEILEKTVPLLLESGMTIERIAAKLGFPVETIQRFVPQN